MLAADFLGFGKEKVKREEGLILGVGGQPWPHRKSMDTTDYYCYC